MKNARDRMDIFAAYQQPAPGCRGGLCDDRETVKRVIGRHESCQAVLHDLFNSQP